MSCRMSRRGLLKSAAVGVSSCWILRHSRSAGSYWANEKLNVALVGVGNRGRGFLYAVPRVGENLVAGCNAAQCARSRIRQNSG